MVEEFKVRWQDFVTTMREDIGPLYNGLFSSMFAASAIGIVINFV